MSGLGKRVPTDANGNPRRRTITEVFVRAAKDAVGIGSGARGEAVDSVVDHASRSGSADSHRDWKR